MQKDYRPCLEKLAGAPPKRKAALIRSLLPGIEAAIHSGQSLKDIWEALGNEGLQMTYHVFHMTVWRARRTRKPTATSSRGKQDKPSESQGLQEAKVEAVEGQFTSTSDIRDQLVLLHFRFQDFGAKKSGMVAGSTPGIFLFGSGGT